MTLNEILVHLGQDLDTTLSLNKEGKCAFTFKETIDVYLEDNFDNKDFNAKCEICELQDSINPIFYEILLETHLLGQGTNGCLFGISKNSKKIILFKNFINDESDYDSFLYDLQGLIKTSIAFQEKLFDIYRTEVARVHTVAPLKSIKI